MYKQKTKIRNLFLVVLLLLISTLCFFTETKTADAAVKDFYGNYISLKLKGKENGEWVISVQNPQSYTVTIEYNRRMCFGNDAAAWNSDLHDLVDFELASQAQDEVHVTPNGFAGYVAFSFVDPIDGKRYISYAHNLSESKLTMDIINVVKS